ncbi:hypothetical protein [Nitratifractor sp.]
MIHLYAHTDYRSDLDALRRMGALLKALRAEGVEAELLVNDYRAQLAGRELGLPPATTIETIHDIDAVAGYGDTVVIDSEEDPSPSLGRFRERFGAIYFVGESPEGCGSIPPFAEDGALVEERYEAARGVDKTPRTVLVYGDSDYDRTLLEHAPQLGELGMELYWGTYFFVKYEEELAAAFGTIHESDAYGELIETSQTVLTPMEQTALEAAAAGARTVWLDRSDARARPFAKYARSRGIETVTWGDWDTLEELLRSDGSVASVSSNAREWVRQILENNSQ